MEVSRHFVLRPLSLAALLTFIALAASADLSSSPASGEQTSTPGKVTGGGSIDPVTGNPVDLATVLVEIGTGGATVGGTANFALSVQLQGGDAAPSGNLNYNDRGANVTIKANSFALPFVIDAGSCGTNTHATFRGTATVNRSGAASTEGFTVEVDDCGEPGSAAAFPDTFKISTSGGYSASGNLIAGNIQVRASGAATPDLSAIQHIVVLMQENRSFDHYFGHLRAYDPSLNVDAEPPNASNPDPTNPLGPPIRAFHRSENMPADWAKYCEVSDLDHSWNGTHVEWDGGKMDGFTQRNQFTNPNPLGASDPKGSRSMGYYTEADLPYYYALYDTFAIGDRYFASVMSQTFPNRFFLLAGTSWVDTSQQYAETGNRFPGPEAPPDQMKGKSVFELLDAAKISWKVYNEEPVLAFANEFAYVRNYEDHVVPIADYYADAQAGTLPQVAFVDPIFAGPNNVENPPRNVQVGENFVAGVLDALMKSPNWSSSAFFLTYDEHGGYYDHVPPPAAVPPDSHGVPAGFAPPAFDRYGIRVPVLVASPYARNHFVSHVVHDHTSILRFIETRFGLPALTNRDAAADPMLEFFDFTNPAFATPPTLPAAPIDTQGLAQCEQLELTTPPGSVGP